MGGNANMTDTDKKPDPAEEPQGIDKVVDDLGKIPTGLKKLFDFFTNPNEEGDDNER